MFYLLYMFIQEVSLTIKLIIIRTIKKINFRILIVINKKKTTHTWYRTSCLDASRLAIRPVEVESESSDQTLLFQSECNPPTCHTVLTSAVYCHKQHSLCCFLPFRSSVGSRFILTVNQILCFSLEGSWQSKKCQ